MSRLKLLMIALMTGASLIAITAKAENFDIPGGDLAAALTSYTKQTGVDLMISGNDVKGVHSAGVRGNLTADDALSRILVGTGFRMKRAASGGLAIVKAASSSASDGLSFQLAQAAPREAVETVTVTSSKLGGADVQSVPIAITALSQEQLTSTQTAGGPDLVKQVPNLTFSKTNFTG